MSFPCVATIDLGRYLDRMDREDRRHNAIDAKRDEMSDRALADFIPWDTARVDRYLGLLDKIAAERVPTQPDPVMLADAITDEAAYMQTLSVAQVLDLASSHADQLEALLDETATDAVDHFEPDFDPPDDPPDFGAHRGGVLW